MRNEEYKHINLIRSKIVPDAHKKQYGSYLSFDDKSISPGCMACKTGGWLCCFIGTKCNCTCPHCPNCEVNGSNDISTISGFSGSRDIDNILSILKKPYYKGVGISGGEPLLYMDKLVEWVTKIKAEYPHFYVWNYTNGVYATEDNLRRLAEAGLDEIRFDLAADNYSELTLANLKKAVKIIPSAAIEVPVILEQYSDLIKAIDYADSIGVKYLNLHDLAINSKIYKGGLGGYTISYDRLSGIQRDIYNSTILIYRILRYIKDSNLHIVPNDCTLINMQMQTLGFEYQNNYKNYKYFDNFMDAVFARTPEEILLLDRIPEDCLTR